MTLLVLLSGPGYPQIVSVAGIGSEEAFGTLPLPVAIPSLGGADGRLFTLMSLVPVTTLREELPGKRKVRQKIPLVPAPPTLIANRRPVRIVLAKSDHVALRLERRRREENALLELGML